jgi:Golgi nucleoside diphosphatase
MLAIFFCVLVAFIHCGGIAGQSEYAIVIDAGSTGSRTFIFNATGDQFEVIAGLKFKPGISQFSSNLQKVADYFMPALLHAATIIPTSAQAATKLHIKGTAGMRLLDDETQASIWNAVTLNLLADERTPFSISPDNIGTISGHLEAYYAVLSSNYIAGIIDSELRYFILQNFATLIKIQAN